MYSSLSSPSHEEWVEESNRLLEELRNNLEYYSRQIALRQEKKDSFMLRFYCLKLLSANKKLKIEKITTS